MSVHQAEARERFRRSVTQAQVADLLGLVMGADDKDLVSYDEVAKRLRARQQIEKGTQMVPLEAIVGSVGRYKDFTRTFLPRAGISQERWARLDAALNSMEGFPPVELFKIGEVYFVRDGNHRVSVARANDATHIEAYVTELETDVPLTLDDFERDRWIIKAERMEFLDETGIDQIRPNHNIEFTEPGRYDMLLEHIEVHRYLRSQEMMRAGAAEPMSWQEAVASWYDNVYLPVVDAIHDYDLLREFPGRTEADLYLWIAHHRERLAAAYELAPLSPEAAVATFAQLHGETLVQRTVKGLLKGLHWVLGDEKPLGMSDEEYQEAKARHEAGEISLAEAQIRQEQADEAAHTIPHDDDPDHGPLSSAVWHPRSGQRAEL
jgi:hypothetical protein